MDPTWLVAGAAVVGAALTLLRFRDYQQSPVVSPIVIQFYQREHDDTWVRCVFENRGHDRELKLVNVIVGADDPDALGESEQVLRFRGETVAADKKSFPILLKKGESYAFEAALHRILEEAEKHATGAGKSWDPIEKMGRLCLIFISDKPYGARLDGSSRRVLRDWLGRHGPRRGERISP